MSSNHIPYPAFSSQCVVELFNIVRGGYDNILAHVPETAKCSWMLVGAGLGVAVGEPGVYGEGPGPDAADEASETDVMNLKVALEHALADGPPAQYGQGPDSQAIDPLTLMLITEALKLALKAVQKWLDKRS